MSELPVIECRGGAGERGRSHGEQLRNEVRDFYTAWVEHTRAQSGATEDDLISYASAHLPASKEYAPELVEEVAGIATGAGMPFESVFLLNCFDEVACHGPGIIKAGLHGCTTFAATGRATSDGRSYVGQGWDMPPLCPPNLLHLISDDQPDVLLVSHPGLVGGAGINEHGLAIVWNTLKAKDAGLGVPAPFVVRKALQATELAALVGSVIGSQRANGMNFVAADPVAAIDLELSATRYHATYSSGILAHANHFEAPEFLELELDIPLDAPDTLLRSGRMRVLLEERHGSVDLTALQSILADHVGGPGSICRHNARGFTTVVSLICVPSERAIWATNGNPCVESFVRYSVERADSGAA
jgi:isopenicillin-N N-acyltransferase-like protein